MKNNFSKNISLVFSVLAVSMIAGSVVIAWTEPGTAPSGGNVAAPVNTSSAAQTKLGDLGFQSGASKPYAIHMDGASLSLVDGTSGSERFIIGQNGKVGIGTTAPSQLLEIDGSAPNTITTPIKIWNDAAGGSVPLGGVAIDFSDTGIPLVPDVTSGRIANVRTDRAFTGDSDLAFSTYSNGVLNEAVRIQDTGNVGIGTAAPGQKLTVSNGNLGLVQEARPSSSLVSLSLVAGPGITGTGYYYRFTFVTSFGETAQSDDVGPMSPTNQKIRIANIPTGSAKVTARKIYRTKNGCVDVCGDYLVTTINDNTTTSYTDSAPDGSLGALSPGNNASGGRLVLYDNSGNSQTVFEAGQNSTRVGYGALASNAASRNTAVGKQAEYSNTYGEWNDAFGEAALYNNTTGSYNAAFGNFSFFQNVTGTSDTGLGMGAGRGNVDGSSNTFLGTFAGNGNNAAYTGSSYNVFVGASSGYSIQSGAGDNVFIGTVSGYSIQSGSSNTAVGCRSGYALTTGQLNILLGHHAGTNLTTGSNNIILGTGIDAPAVNSSNIMILGNSSTLYGDLANNRVGIGTTSPAAKLEVNGNIKVDSGGASGKVVCWKADKTLGSCSNAPNASGVCTCN